jgi:hypothetical protein
MNAPHFVAVEIFSRMSERLAGNPRSSATLLSVSTQPLQQESDTRETRRAGTRQSVPQKNCEAMGVNGFGCILSAGAVIFSSGESTSDR